MRRGVPSLIAGLATGAVAAFTLWTLNSAPPPMNVVVVSACSLRPDRLAPYNPKFTRAPKIAAWAKNSIVFTNAIAERPWQNYIFESRDVISRDFLERHDYQVGPDSAPIHVPPVQRSADGEEWYWDEQSILHYQDDMLKLKEAILAPHEKAFYLITHLKYMHYPYFDPVNWTAEDLKKLSPKSRELLERYQDHPERFAAQLPVIEALQNNFKLLKKQFGVAGRVYSAAGVISDPERDEEWQRTAGFAADLQLANELYDLKMEKFDDIASDVLNLYGDPKLQENTVVIFTGDHGEALMEHGVIGHSVNVYDEMLRFPLMVKFPESLSGQTVTAQVNHLQLAKIVRGILAGNITALNFSEKVAELSADYVLSRNCSNTIRSVRSGTGWKLIQNLSSGRNQLYNLLADPGEKADLIGVNGDMAWKLEEYLLDHQKDLLRTNTRALKSKVCLEP